MSRPVDQDLRRLLVELLGNVNDLGLVDDSGLASGVVTERRVSSDDNVLLLALKSEESDDNESEKRGQKDRLTVLEELGLDQAGVTLNLVHGGNDTSLLDELLQKLNVKVGNTDGFDFLCLLGDPDQLLPGVYDARSIPVNGNLAVLSLREEVAPRSKRHRPVNEVDIKVVGAELLEGGVKVGLNLLGSVRVVPELGDKEEVLSWDTRGLDTLGDLQIKLAHQAHPRLNRIETCLVLVFCYT